jgi:hypothetical protein
MDHRSKKSYDHNLGDGGDDDDGDDENNHC